ncbi:MAG: DUF3502 domain-containing protein [Clostridia bacterium]|nr:DUF3502 domain-containing protein [Clostridia bacterium]
MKKKLLSILLATTIISGFAGCKKTDSKPVITWCLPGSMTQIKEDAQKKVEDAANKIISEAGIDATLKLKMIDNASFTEKMRLMSSSGENYDLTLTSSWLNPIDDNVDRGGFIELDELIEKYGSSIKEKVDKRAWDAAKYDGKIMAIPSQNAYATTKSYVFKKDLVDKYNIDYKNIHTLEELESFLKVIKENEPGITPAFASQNRDIPGSENPDLTPVCSGIAWDEANQKLTYKYQDPITLDKYRKVNEYYKKGYIAKDAAIKSDYMSEVKTGKYGVVSNPGIYTEDGSKSTNAYGYDCVESYISTTYMTTSSFQSTMTAISSSSKNPELAMRILNLVWKNKKLSNLLAYGIEGDNYTVTDNSDPDMPVISVKNGAEQTWGISHNYIGPLFDQWGSEWNSREAIEEIMRTNEDAKLSGLYGFSLNKEPIKSKLVQIGSIITEVNQVFYTGSMADFDSYVDEVNNRLKSAGIEEVYDEVKNQIDAWKNK